MGFIPEYRLIDFPSPDAYRQAAGPIATEFENIMALVHHAIELQGNLSQRFSALFPYMFRLRMMALLDENFSLNALPEAAADFYDRLADLKEVQGLDKLLEAAKFATKVYRRVATTLAESIPMDALRQEVTDSAMPTYEDLRLICHSVPRGNVLLDWINSSMLMEFCLIALHDFVFEDKLIPGDTVLTELADVLSQSAQTYGGCARRMGLVQPRNSGKRLSYPETLSDEALAEQKRLAEFGLSEWAASLPADN